MRKFVRRALNKLPYLAPDHIRRFVSNIALEHDRLEVVLDSMSDGVVVADPDHRLIMHNKAVDRLLPMIHVDVHEQPIWFAIDDAEISAFVRATLLNEETIYDRHFTLNTQPARILSCSIIPLVREGYVEGNILRVEDITEKRTREARLRRAENLASLTTLAATVAHEIKNPLGSIGIHVQLIRRILETQSDDWKPQLDTHIDVVLEEIERLNAIVVDFLFAVRPVDIDPELRDINEVARELINFVRYELSTNAIELSETLGSDLPLVSIDEKYLKQALLNIVKNAIEAMPDGGRLEIGTVAEKEAVIISIADTGIGMSSEVVERIFEPYYTTKTSGSGIGLTMVYKIVKEHGGEIRVQSEPNRGACFVITLPIPQSEQRLLAWNREIE